LGQPPVLIERAEGRRRRCQRRLPVDGSRSRSGVHGRDRAARRMDGQTVVE